MNTSLEDVAISLISGSIKTEEQFLNYIDGHWEFRINKSMKDVQAAIKKGIKSGMHKTESEISGIALYLKLDVLKKVRSKKAMK